MCSRRGADSVEASCPESRGTSFPFARQLCMSWVESRGVPLGVQVECDTLHKFIQIGRALQLWTFYLFSWPTMMQLAGIQRFLECWLTRSQCDPQQSHTSYSGKRRHSEVHIHHLFDLLLCWKPILSAGGGSHLKKWTHAVTLRFY